MKVTIVGTGYIGLTEGVCFADIGHTVVCVDKDESKIETLQKGIPTLYEEGLDEILTRNIKNNRISFTTNLEDALKNADAAIIAVNTPENPRDGSADLTAVHGVAKEIAKKADCKKHIMVITRSTVPVGTNKEIKKIIQRANPKLKFEIVSNPEFSKQGTSIKDFLQPDRVVIGVESEIAKSTMAKLYEPIYRAGYPVVFTNIETAELIKYASNAFLAVKIGFVNEMCDLCKKSGADIKELSKAMGMDSRISEKFLTPGPGYGGSCFPKDTNALVNIGKKYKVNVSIVDATIKSNNTRKKNLAKLILSAHKGSIRGKTISVLGLAFKANTDDTRYSPALAAIEELVKAGAKIKAYDPEATEKAKTMLSKIALSKTEFCKNMYDTMKDSELIAVLTEWDDFKKIDFSKAKKLLKNHVVVDLRNIFDRIKVTKEGFEYHSLC